MENRLDVLLGAIEISCAIIAIMVMMESKKPIGVAFPWLSTAKWDGLICPEIKRLRRGIASDASRKRTPFVVDKTQERRYRPVVSDDWNLSSGTLLGPLLDPEGERRDGSPHSTKDFGHKGSINSNDVAVGVEKLSAKFRQT